jgi:hypothetical protein
MNGIVMIAVVGAIAIVGLLMLVVHLQTPRVGRGEPFSRADSGTRGDDARRVAVRLGRIVRCLAIDDGDRRHAAEGPQRR